MSKDELVQHLTKLGYDAENKNGVVYVTTEEMPNKKEFGKLVKIIDGAGYNSSYGFRKKQHGKTVTKA